MQTPRNALHLFWTAPDREGVGKFFSHVYCITPRIFLILVFQVAAVQTKT